MESSRLGQHINECTPAIQFRLDENPLFVLNQITFVYVVLSYRSRNIYSRFPSTFLYIQWAFHFDESKHLLRLALSGEVISTGIYLLSNEEINIAYSASAATYSAMLRPIF